MRYFLLFSAILSVQILCAQVPGYLGKRLYAKVDGMFMLSMGPSAKNNGLFDKYYSEYSDKEGGDFGIDYRLGASIGYAFSRVHGWAVSANYLKTGMHMDAQYNSNNLPELFYTLKGYTLGLGRMTFKQEKGGLAPFGSFFGLHVQTSFLRGTFNEEITGAKKGNIDLGFEPKRLYFSLGLEYGQHDIVKDKLLLSYSLQLHLPLMRPARVVDILLEQYDTYGTDSGDFNQRSFDYTAAMRMLLHDLLAVKIGFGLVR